MRLWRWLSSLPSPWAAVELFGTFAIVFLVLGAWASDGTSEGDTFVDGVPWTAWLMIASAAVLLFLVLAMHAISILIEPDQWGIPEPGRRVWTYPLAAFGLVAVLAIVQFVKGHSPPMPVQGLEWRTRGLLWVGLLASIPWLSLVWMAHDECRKLFAAYTAPRSGAPDVPDPELLGGLDQLLRLYKLLTSCVGAFALAVVAAILMSGAQRAAYLDFAPGCQPEPPAGAGSCPEEFPASNVLLYGAVFAVLLTIIAAPLVIRWRAAALAFVDRAYALPRETLPDATWVADRDRLAKILRLDVPILRNPLIALSIFTPLIASTLAAFVPQLTS